MPVARTYQVAPNSRVRLDDIDPGDVGGFAGKLEAETSLQTDRERIARLQQLLYAGQERAVLVVLQAMDAGGKDGTVRNVFSGVNPQGCVVTAFKVPTEEEKAHDFLWRVHQRVPRRGEIGVFNRSHYEDVLVPRVRGWLEAAALQQRLRQINDFERMLTENGTVLLKLFLHISKDEQRRRLQSRIDDPTKNWKVDEADLHERRQWDDYRHAYEDLLSECSTPHAPWQVIPADKKWARNAVVSRLVREVLENLGLQPPKARKSLVGLAVE